MVVSKNLKCHSYETYYKQKKIIKFNYTKASLLF